VGAYFGALLANEMLTDPLAPTYGVCGRGTLTTRGAWILEVMYCSALIWVAFGVAFEERQSQVMPHLLAPAPTLRLLTVR
jgi:hypothetical protein